MFRLEHGDYTPCHPKRPGIVADEFFQFRGRARPVAFDYIHQQAYRPREACSWVEPQRLGGQCASFFQMKSAQHQLGVTAEQLAVVWVVAKQLQNNPFGILELFAMPLNREHQEPGIDAGRVHLQCPCDTRTRVVIIVEFQRDPAGKQMVGDIVRRKRKGLGQHTTCLVEPAPFNKALNVKLDFAEFSHVDPRRHIMFNVDTKINCNANAAAIQAATGNQGRRGSIPMISAALW
jgi:hypothetical protein